MFVAGVLGSLENLELNRCSRAVPFPEVQDLVEGLDLNDSTVIHYSHNNAVHEVRRVPGLGAFNDLPDGGDVFADGMEFVLVVDFNVHLIII